jgi:hypothetical protein
MMQKPYLALARFEFEEADGGAEGRVRESSTSRV